MSWTDTSPVAVEYLDLKKNLGTHVQLRNLRNPDSATSLCVNNVGSFICIDTSTDEKVAIGWGGHTDSGSSYRSEVSVVRSDGTSCIDHNIPNYGGRIRNMLGVVGKWLVLCGGYAYGGSDSKDCRKLNLSKQSPGWIVHPALPYVMRHGAMYTYDGYLYVCTGWNSGSRNYHYRIAEDGSSWQSRAAAPRSMYEATTVVDEPNGRMFLLGGYDGNYHRAEVYVYTFSSNSWYHHSNTPRARYYKAATIIKQKNGERWLMHQDIDYREIYYYNLDTNSGWHHVSTVAYKQSGKMMMVSLTPNSAFMMGGYSGGVYSYSTENFYVYNPENYKFERINRNVQLEHAWGYKTTTSKNWAVLANCRAERTYVAVGWGGDDFNTDWSVLLRKTWETQGNYRNPATCHGVIPTLSPARKWPAIATMDYTLVVCGGRLSMILLYFWHM